MPHRSARIGRRLVRGCAAGVAAAAILSIGASYRVAHGALSGITVSEALGVEDPRSAAGEMNILLIGLDSRKDQAGRHVHRPGQAQTANGGRRQGRRAVRRLGRRPVPADAGTGRRRFAIAGGVSDPAGAALRTGDIRDPLPTDPTGTRIDYGSGATARSMAELLNIDAPGHADPDLAAGYIRIVLGDNYFPPPLDGETGPTSTATHYGRSAVTTTSTGPDAGKPIESGGVPCVN